jgi:hypothetical protein
VKYICETTQSFASMSNGLDQNVCNNSFVNRNRTQYTICATVVDANDALRN